MLRKINKVTSIILFLVGFLIGSLMMSAIIHIFGCGCTTRVEAIEEKPIITKMIEEPKVELVTEVEPEIISLGQYKLTAYCACSKCCGKTDGITASGVKATEGVTVAADTRTLPFGSKILIGGHEYTVQDTGGAIKGNRIDVYFDSHQKALEFGVQYKEIYLVKEGETNEEM